MIRCLHCITVETSGKKVVFSQANGLKQLVIASVMGLAILSKRFGHSDRSGGFWRPLQSSRTPPKMEPAACTRHCPAPHRTRGAKRLTKQGIIAKNQRVPGRFFSKTRCCFCNFLPNDFLTILDCFCDLWILPNVS